MTNLLTTYKEVINNQQSIDKLLTRQFTNYVHFFQNIS